MTSPAIWIILPVAISALLWFFEHKRLVTMLASTATCLLLALLAFVLPVDNQVNFGGISFIIDSSLNVLGRYFILDNASRGVLAFLFSSGAFWFLGGYFSNVHRYFWPLGLSILGLLVGALAVRPFFYSALIIEVAVLLSIPLLFPPGLRIGQGGLRYLIFQSLAVPIILFAGWFAAGVDSNPGNQQLILLAVIFIGLGVAFWLAVFPFYTWIPLLLEETNLYSGVVVISLLNNISLLTLLNFVDSFGWLRTFSYFPEILHLVGAIMAFVAGLMALFEKRLTRLLGFSIILETGISLVTLSILNSDGYGIYLTMLLPRLMSIGVLTLSLTALMNDGVFFVDDIKGLLYKRPVIVLSFLIAFLNIGGLPLLPSFPLRFVVYQELSQSSLLTALWVFSGQMLFLITGFRLIYRFSINRQSEWNLKDKWPMLILPGLSALGLILMGIFPNWLLNLMVNLLKEFPHLNF
jgi:NADH-quinone oxidoreductase subunit N